MDRIFIEKLKVFAHHGVMEEETINGQEFFIDCELFLDITKAAAEDDLNKTINYAQVSNFIYEYATGHTFKLIETLSDRLCKEIIKNFGRVKEAEITVYKPNAPITFDNSDELMSFENVSVKCKRGRHRAFLSIGSNMGDSKAILEDAIKTIDEDRYCKVISQAEFIVTKPYGDIVQDDFINSAIEIETVYEPYELLRFLNEVELQFGRERKIHWGPRTLDLDIVFYDDVVINDRDLNIPHIDMQNREFVLKPLCEIGANKIHPVFKKTVRRMYDELLSR